MVMHTPDEYDELEMTILDLTDPEFVVDIESHDGETYEVTHYVPIKVWDKAQRLHNPEYTSIFDED